MIKAKHIRSDLGLQLHNIRHNKNLTMQYVSNKTQISMQMLDEIEIGYPRAWLYYRKLLDFYQCEIKLVEKG